MTPIVNGLAEEFSDKVSVVRLDVAEKESEQLQQHYGLRGHPAFVVLDENGRVAQTFIGPQTEETLWGALTAVSNDG